MFQKSMIGFFCAIGLGLAVQVRAGQVGWTSWSSATPSSGTTAGSATGTMNFGTGSVTVNYTGELDSNTETGGVGTNYIVPLSTYTSSTVSNAPPAGNLITVTGGTSFTDTVTFSSPVQNFLMAFVSLGAPPVSVTYQFNTKAPISVLSTGTGAFGGNVDLAVGHTAAGFDTITGRESDGVVQFSGNFSSISWTIPPPGEFWDGWTFGALAQAPPNPPPPTAVPLPSSAWMCLSFLGGLGLIQLGRKRLARRPA